MFGVGGDSVNTLESPIMPYTPTVVHAGGIHCRPPHPLPQVLCGCMVLITTTSTTTINNNNIAISHDRGQDLEEWVAGSGDAGFILFSLGSIIKPSEMSIK